MTDPLTDPVSTPRALAGILAALIVTAQQANDQRYHSAHLKRGLLIEIGLGDHLNLKLSRYGKTPSDREWQIVINALPPDYRPADPITPETSQHAGHHCLKAHWPIARLL